MCVIRCTARSARYSSFVAVREWLDFICNKLGGGYTDLGSRGSS